MRKLVIEPNRTNFSEYIRVVLDDDKLQFEGRMKNWDGIKKVRHEKKNRFGAVMHTLASSSSNVIFSVSTEREGDTTFDCVRDCLISSFPKRNDDRDPDLKKVIIGFDRGYNGFLQLVSYIIKCNGNTFGTTYTHMTKRRGSGTNEYS